MIKEKLEKVVKEILRNLCDNEYLDKLLYLFTFLFLKMLSDTWNWKKSEYEKKYPDYPERIERLMENQPFILRQDWEMIKSYLNYPNIGKFLQEYLHHLQKENPILEGIFDKMDWEKIESEPLKNMVQILDTVSLAIKDENDSAIWEEVIDEVLMGNIDSVENHKGDPSMDFTPRSTAQLLAYLMEVKLNESIADLVCGSGGLLLQAVDCVEDRKCQIWGQDINSRMVQLCQLNMILHGVLTAQIRQGNTIFQNDWKEQADVILANPPFSITNSIKKIEEETFLGSRESYPYGIPPAARADYGFIQKMLQRLKPDGRMVTLIALGALSRTGVEEKIRENMVRDNVVDTVILLPPNLFKNTSIKTCIMVLKKNRAQSDILFIDASDEYEKGRTQNQLGVKNQENILNWYHERRTKDGICYVATQKEVLENHGNLSVMKYVEEKKVDERINLEQLRMEIRDKEEQLRILQNKKEFYFSKLNNE